ncbi:cytochrome c [Candidatus Halobeggiatoa sp. HSG11]|nr:cytochrome c [Candidatus Halobeggiatoa sp. HSG11]
MKILTKPKYIYYSSLIIFICLLLGLTIHTIIVLPERDHRDNLTPQIIQGKMVWEENNCIGCHTLLGEGAYFAPELGNIYKRRGGSHGGAYFIKAWLKAMPTNIPGRRQMPQFNLTDEELHALIAFLKWTSEINTSSWPPSEKG